MNQFKFIDSSAENLRQFWEGPSNRFTRYMNYLSRGMGRFNEISKYAQIVIGIVLTNRFVTFMGYKIEPTWIVLAGLSGIPIIIFIGRWDLFKAQKATEFINAQHGSVIGFKGYNVGVWNVALMEAIAQKLGVDIDKLKEDLNK